MTCPACAKFCANFRFALEDNTILELLDVNGVSVAVNDDQDTDAGLLCSKITQQRQAGTYYLAVHGVHGSGLNGRRYAVSARLEP